MKIRDNYGRDQFEAMLYNYTHPITISLDTTRQYVPDDHVVISGWHQLSRVDTGYYLSLTAGTWRIRATGLVSIATRTGSTSTYLGVAVGLWHSGVSGEPFEKRLINRFEINDNTDNVKSLQSSFCIQDNVTLTQSRNITLIASGWQTGGGTGNFGRITLLNDIQPFQMEAIRLY